MEAHGFSLLSGAVMHDQQQRRRERVGFIPQLVVHHDAKPGQNLDKAWSPGLEHQPWRNPGFFSEAHLASFVKQSPRTTFPGMTPPTVDINHKNTQGLPAGHQSSRSIFLIEVHSSQMIPAYVTLAKQTNHHAQIINTNKLFLKFRVSLGYMKPSQKECVLMCGVTSQGL